MHLPLPVLPWLIDQLRQIDDLRYEFNWETLPRDEMENRFTDWRLSDELRPLAPYPYPGQLAPEERRFDMALLANAIEALKQGRPRVPSNEIDVVKGAVEHLKWLVSRTFFLIDKEDCSWAWPKLSNCAHAQPNLDGAGCRSEETARHLLELTVLHAQAEAQPQQSSSLPVVSNPTRKRPAAEKHATWRQWREGGFSYGQIRQRHLDETGEEVTTDAIAKAMRRYRTP